MTLMWGQSMSNNQAYHLLGLLSLMSKTKETDFWILNITICTNNKALKFRMREDPNCELYGPEKIMEHLLNAITHNFGGMPR
jgi:hypothetical protein